MYHEYKNTKVNYKVIGNGMTAIVFLHGWGGNIKSFEFIVNCLCFDYKAVLIDFPPFGESETPNSDFTIFDYEKLVIEIMNKENITSPIIVGHSFGGRVAILLASSGNCKKLILTASAGLKPKRSIKYKFKIVKKKICNKLGLKYNCGSADYNALPKNMKKTFVNIVTTYLEKYAININVPTILFWGKKDKDTPFYMAKRLQRLIKDSEIIAFKNSGHFCYINNLKSFIAVINFFATN